MSLRSVLAPFVGLCLAAALGPAVVSPPGAAAAPTPRAAAAEDTWGPVQKFGRDAGDASMVVDTRGVATVAWTSVKTWPSSIMVARRTANGVWKTPVTVGRGRNPVIGADASGTLTVAWERDRNDVTTGVWAASRAVGKPWTAPVRLSADKPAPGYPDGGDVRGASDLALAVHPEGASLVTWQWGNRTPAMIQAAFRPADGAWRNVVDLTPAADATNPYAAFGPTGRVWVAYNRTPEDGPTAVKVRFRMLNGTWTAPARVGAGQLGGLGVSRYSEVTVAFRSGGVVKTALWSPVAGWQAPTPATPPGSSVQEWAFASNRRGAGLVVYSRPNSRIDAARRTNHGTWLAPVTLAAPGGNAFPTAAMNADGDMFGAWGTYGVWAAYRPSGGDWHPTTTVLPDTGGVDVLEATASQVAPNGDALLLWEQEARPLRARVMTPGS